MNETTHNKQLGYLFLIFGFLGFHRFYYNKPITGTIYLCTFGIFGVGILYDLFFMEKLMSEVNQIKFTQGDANYSIGWLLFLFGGIFGLHKLYLEKPFIALLYFMTGGLGGLLLIYDLMTYNKQISDFNKKHPQN